MPAKKPKVTDWRIIAMSGKTADGREIDHIHDWWLGTDGKWVTMGIPSDGAYGIPEETMFGFPVTCENGEYKLIGFCRRFRQWPRRGWTREKLPCARYSKPWANKKARQALPTEAALRALSLACLRLSKDAVAMPRAASVLTMAPRA